MNTPATETGRLPGDALNTANSPQSTPGTNTLLMGAPGSGKTHSIRTLAASLHIEEVFVLFTEPGMEVLGDTDPRA